MEPRRAAHPLRVLLVDNQPAARCAARQLAGHAGVSVVGLAGDGDQALATAAACAPDVAVVDMLLPDGNGYALARRLRDRFPELRVVVTGHESHPRLGALAQSVGAAGFLPLPALTAETLLALVPAVAAHRTGGLAA